MFLRCSQIFNLALASLSYGTPAVPALASGHPCPGGDPPQPPLDASSAEITTINQQQQPPRAHCTYNDRRLEGTSHPQHVSLPPSCGQPQRLSPSVMEHTLNVLATIIEKNPAFLVALNQLVAQFMPPPQPESSPPPQTRQHIPRLRCSSRSRNERSRSPRSAPGQNDTMPTQGHRQIQDGDHSTPAHLPAQDGGWPSQGTPQDSTSGSNGGSSTKHGMEQPGLRNAEDIDFEEWPLLGATPKKRRWNPLATETAGRSTPTSHPTQTVVLRSIGKKEVNSFTGKEIQEAVKKAGIQNLDGYAVHRNEKANTIAITTRDPLMLEKLLQVKEIRKGEDTHALQPYKALAGNQCRGVIYLLGQGNTVTPESLQADITCKGRKIASARPIGTKGNTVLVTFEGKILPKKVTYMCEVLNVREYRPRPLVCFRCHTIGHKMDVCPRSAARCGTCGSEHDAMETCSRSPQCVNCSGAHLATSNDCPKRAIPERRNKRPRARQEQGKGKLPPPEAHMAPPKLQSGGTSYAAVTAATSEPVATPAHQLEQHDITLQTLQAQQASFARMEKQLAALTAAIHRLIDTHNDKY